MENEITNNITNVELNESLQKTPEDFFVIDLMSKDDFANRHIPGSINIPIDELKNHIDEIPKNKIVVMACNRGLMKSEMGLQQLKSSGIKNVKKLEGGIFGWFDLFPAKNSL